MVTKMVRQVPNLLRIAIHAFMKDRALWQTTVYKVQQKNIKRLPQSTIVLLQPAIARAIDRESKFEEKSSEELLLIFAMRINHYFGFSLLKGADASLKFLLTRCPPHSFLFNTFVLLRDRHEVTEPQRRKITVFFCYCIV